MAAVFPGSEWERRSPEDLGLSSDKLSAIESSLIGVSEGKPFQLAVARNGYLAYECGQGVESGSRQAQASAAKSFYSCLLGIAVEEGKLSSPDEKLIDHYPEFMDVGEDEGPKPGRYAFDKDRDITFRQLICNVSGYMKPDEEPGKVFHYQTYGMNILTHALAKLYDLYDVQDPDRLPGCGELLEQKIRDRIGATWTYTYTNFKLQPSAKLNIFGNYLQMHVATHDLLRAGHLWLNGGNWNGTQVVPKGYLDEATKTNPFILENAPEEKWHYGHGFWVNDHGKQWPDLPRDSYAASGAGAKHTWVCPSLGLVVVQNPGLWDQFAGKDEGDRRAASQNEVLRRVVEAIE